MVHIQLFLILYGFMDFCTVFFQSPNITSPNPPNAISTKSTTRWFFRPHPLHHVAIRSVQSHQVFLSNRRSYMLKEGLNRVVSGLRGQPTMGEGGGRDESHVVEGPLDPSSTIHLFIRMHRLLR